MCIRKRTLMVWGMVTVALLVGVWGLPDTAKPASAQADPLEVLQAYEDALNAGDVDAVLELYTDDAVWAGPPLCWPVECVGKDAIRNAMEYAVAANFHVTTTSSEVTDNTVIGTGESVSDHERAIGTDRTVASFTVEVSDGKISEYRAMPDVTDPQTAQLVAHSMEHSVTFELGPGRDADQSPGSAFLMGYGSKTSVLVDVTPGAAGVPQPIHIHEGSCANLGAVAFALQDIDTGKSGTVLDVSMDDLQTGEYAINVHKSEEEPDVYVACGDIPAAAPEAPPLEPAPAPEAPPVIAPAPAPAAVAPATGSGGLLPEKGSGVATWWYALVAGGAVLVIVGLAGLGKASIRR